MLVSELENEVRRTLRDSHKGKRRRHTKSIEEKRHKQGTEDTQTRNEDSTKTGRKDMRNTKTGQRQETRDRNGGKDTFGGVVTLTLSPG